MKIIIIMPTYNEAENVGLMIDHLGKIFESLPHQMELMVVDDNSPDGTPLIVQEKMKGRSWLRLVTGEKEGLGKAYLRGMARALDWSADAVFEMDCDFSHDPADIPRLIAALEEGYDFVIGSRYVVGGSIPKEWSFLRKLNSFGGNIVARYVAGIYRIKDCTAGFRCIRSEILRKINLSNIKTQGYGFQVSLLHAAFISGARIKEIPVHFTDRTRGVSKLGLRDIIEFVINAAAIRLTGMQTFLRFCLVGASGVLVNLGIFHVLLQAGLHRYLASPLAVEASIVWNFMLNSLWTFRSRKSLVSLRLQGLRFNAVSLLALFVSFSVFYVLTQVFPSLSPYLAQLAGIVPATFINYFLNSYWTFADNNSRS